MQLGFRAKLVLGSTAKMTAFVVVTVLVLDVLTGRHAERQLAQQIDDARASFTAQMSLHLRSWRRETREFARSPLLLPTAAIPGVDAATFADVLAGMEAPLVAVLDPHGKVLASSGGWSPGADLAAMPGLSQGMQTGVADHLWAIDGGMALVAVAPLTQGDELLGALVRGERIDDRFAQRLGAVSGSDVLLVDDHGVLGQRWREPLAEPVDPTPLGRWSHSTLPASGSTVELRVAGEPRFGLALRLHEDGGIAFLSHDLHTIAALRDEGRLWLLGAGTVLASFGVGFSLYMASRLTRPLAALTTAADRIGGGELATRVDAVGMDHELGTLARSFNLMATTMQSLIADVTDKAARAEAANRAKDGFLSSISHELRTPLTGIQSTAELLQQFGDGASPEERGEFLATILREAERLGRRISDALDYATLASGTTRWTLGRVELQQVCEQACRRLDGLQALKQVDLQLLCDPDAALLGDREQITQALFHLVHNAWTWSPPHEAVEVQVQAVQQGYVLSVRDRGPGLSPADRERVFDAFTQGGDALVDKPAGIGVGLKIAGEVARMHGGALDYSDRDGGGACFHLLLRTEDRPIDRWQQLPQGSAAGPVP
jgi:signal transduction histidine kinase